MLDPRQPASQRSSSRQIHLLTYSAQEEGERPAVLQKDGTPILGALWGPTSQKSTPTGHKATAF